MDTNIIVEKINSCLAECKIRPDSIAAISSLDIVYLAVKVEKAFAIKFKLDEISEDNFNSIEKLTQLVAHKLAK